MQKKFRVSIAMCTYNGSLYIEDQLKSIVSQTYPIDELLIYDDASTDATLDIAKRFEAKYPFIKVHVNKTNVGYTKNFEQAVKAATGDVIAIADQDDIWLETKIEKLVNAWRDESPLIYSGALMFRDRLPDKFELAPNYRQFEGQDARRIFLRNTISGHALMIKRDFLKLVLPFKEGVMYDWWMGVVAAYNGGVQFYPEVLVMQREHENNVTLDSGNRNTKTEKRKIYKQKVVSHCDAFQKAPNIPQSHKKFADEVASLMKRSFSQKFYLPLFLFLMKNRKILFNYKRRKIGFFSYLKHSFRRTIN
jgi:glycosyltransferase involved in cell wall biosynthesis